MVCRICRERKATQRHSKDYNHKNIKAKGNCVFLCEFCHAALHKINKKNSLDWEYLMRVKKQEIIENAEKLSKR